MPFGACAYDACLATRQFNFYSHALMPTFAHFVMRPGFRQPRNAAAYSEKNISKTCFCRSRAHSASLQFEPIRRQASPFGDKRAHSAVLRAHSAAEWALNLRLCPSSPFGGLRPRTQADWRAHSATREHVRQIMFLTHFALYFQCFQHSLQKICFC